MNTYLFGWIMSLTMALLCACTSEDVRGNRPDDSLPAITVSEAMKPASFGRTIRVRGTIAAICQTEGCWMVISDGASYLRMTFKNEDFAVPMDKTGDVIVEGVITESIYSAQDARSMASALGKTKEEIAPDDTDVRLATMVATGVQFLAGN
jgi:Domain of unknown function (DUF4920)